MTEAKAAAPEQTEIPEEKGKSKSSGAAAASAEANGKQPEIDFRGVKFKLPAKLPGSLALKFTDDPEEQPAMVRSLIRSALGADQMKELSTKLDEDEVSFDDVYGILNKEILEPIFNAYNLDQGKSEASDGS